MPNSTLQDLFVDQLRDVYDAEKQLTKALPKLAKAASDRELIDAFKMHLEQTKGQAGRLERVFEAIGVKARSKPCEAMKGLVAEGTEAIEEDLPGALGDLALVACARRVEHYEMAAYDSMIAIAQGMKKPDAVSLLQETLKEETETDKKLATIGKRLIKESGSPATVGKSASKAAPPPVTAKKSAPAPSSKAAKSKSKSDSADSSSHEGHGSLTTTDHEEIQQWAEKRGGKPASVEGTGGKGDVGLLRIEFPGKPNANDSKLEEISWDEFFEKFDEHGLALLYQETTASGELSNFNKLITRESSAKSSKSKPA